MSWKERSLVFGTLLFICVIVLSSFVEDQERLLFLFAFIWTAFVFSGVVFALVGIPKFFVVRRVVKGKFDVSTKVLLGEIAVEAVCLLGIAYVLYDLQTQGQTKHHVLQNYLLVFKLVMIFVFLLGIPLNLFLLRVRFREGFPSSASRWAHAVLFAFVMPFFVAAWITLYQYFIR